MHNRILVLQQVPHEGLGSIYPLLRRAGAAEEVVPCYHPDATVPRSLNGYRGLIVLGGPMSVNDSSTDPVLGAELRLVQEAIAHDFPTLGICLGAQFIALAAGARVFPGPAPEIGWDEVHLSLESSRDQVFSGLPNPLPVFQWHGEGFDLPRGAVHLASSPRFPHQAFRIGSCVYALQFHMETDAPMVKEWMAVNHEELVRLGRSGDPALEHDADTRCGGLAATAEHIVGRWLELSARRGA
ncbi:MAG: gamma-glutamyl-gamma-aminobutyrate hydrolase family protein [Nitrospirota bacterium]|nr:gamma-glutamyl-gamma-aminobutyrate hydrolase family protein [Nitrospirota bacterium]